MIRRIIRFPIWIVSFLLGAWGIAYAVAIATVGSWLQNGLSLLNIKNVPGWVFLSSGIVLYTGGFLILPAFWAFHLIGWPGILLAPLLGTGLVAYFGKWFSRKEPDLATLPSSFR